MVSLETLVLSLALLGGGGGSNQVVLLEFSSESCTPCRSMVPVVQRLENEGYPVRRINVDQQPQLAQQWAIKAIPCFILVQDGREVDRISGRSSYDALVRLYRRAGYQADAATVRGQSPEEDSQSEPHWAAVSNKSAPSKNNQQISAPAQREIQGQSAEHVARAASVRITVKETGGNAIGSGTIIDVHNDEALVVTCGHLFRDSKGQMPILVELVGANGSEAVPGQLIAYHADDIDIALVAIRPGVEVTPVPVATGFDGIAAGASVFSIGCDHGGEPRVIRSRITAIDKYVGRTNYSQNIEVAGQPADGRSGGGLFDAQGRLIGICNGAEATDNEGFFAGLKTIQWQLDDIGLARIYNSPGRAQPEATLAAAEHEEVEVAHNPSGHSRTRPNLMAAIESGAELICVVRVPGEKESRVLVLDQSSRQLLSRYARELDDPAASVADLPDEDTTVRAQDGRY